MFNPLDGSTAWRQPKGAVIMHLPLSGTDPTPSAGLSQFELQNMYIHSLVHKE